VSVDSSFKSTPCYTCSRTDELASGTTLDQFQASQQQPSPMEQEPEQATKNQTKEKHKSPRIAGSKEEGSEAAEKGGKGLTASRAGRG
jgi:hypothetical protein